MMKQAREGFKTAALIVGGIAPLSEDGGAFRPSREKIGGLTVLERILLACRKAGVVKIVLAGLEDPEIAECQENRFKGMTIRFLKTGRGGIDREFLSAVRESVGEEAGWYLISGDCVFESGALLELGRNQPLPKGIEAAAAIRRDPGVPEFQVPRVEIRNGRITRIRTCSEHGEEAFQAPGLFLCDKRLIETMEQTLTPVGEASALECLQRVIEGEKMGFTPMQGLFLRYVGTERALKLAQGLIFQTLGKKTDGFLAGHVNRKVSVFITKFLVNTPLTPNQATLINLMIGLMGAVFLARGGYGSTVAGALLFQVSSITDGCDGEIARLKFMESRLGGWLDLLCDNLTHMAVFGAIAYGAYRMEPAPYLILCGWMAVLGALMSFLLVALQLYGKESGTGPFFVSVVESRAKSGTSLEGMLDWQDTLARRDFTYVLLLFALAGHMKIFLLFTAVGVNVFWIFLAYSLIRLRRRSSCI